MPDLDAKPARIHDGLRAIVSAGQNRSGTAQAAVRSSSKGVPHRGRGLPDVFPTAGPYAGEWEGAMLQECVVQAPCSVLRALRDYYEIKLPDPKLTQQLYEQS